jgi:hypothetical protein
METVVVAGAAQEDIFIAKQTYSLRATENIRDVDARLMHSEVYHKPALALH